MPEVYISSSGTGVSGSKMMPVLVHSPSGSVERSARARLSRLAPQSTVTGNGPGAAAAPLVHLGAQALGDAESVAVGSV